MKRLFVCVFTVITFLFLASINSYSKDVEIYASVENISFGIDKEGSGAVYFTLKESEYADKAMFNGKSVKFLVNVADTENCRKNSLSLFWVLFIIKDYFSGAKQFFGTPFPIKINLAKREITSFIFIS